MSWSFDDQLVHKHLIVGGHKEGGLGSGNWGIPGSIGASGVVSIGAEQFGYGQSTLMVATSKEQKGRRACTVYGGQTIAGGGKYPLIVRGNAHFGAGIGDLKKRFSAADGRPKPFDMKHPSGEKGWRLRYACIEGPEVGVYTRGRVRNKKEILLPDYWKDLVHEESISVQLQPIGAHQDVIVKRWDKDKIYLQSNGGMPIDCFYHVYAERKDVNALITEYKGESWEDYPDSHEYDDPQYKGVVNTQTK